MPSPQLALSLTDEQLDCLFRLAAPLREDDRGPFLKDCADALVALPEIGDGSVAQIAVLMQRRYWQPPDLSRKNDSSKYR